MKKLLPAFALLVAPLAAFSQAQIVINGTTPVYMVENGGTIGTPIYIEVNNPATNAIGYANANRNGWIVSETEFDMVKWDLTAASTGLYIVPFGYNATSYLPLQLNLTSIGNPPANGGVKFSTWHTNADNWTTPAPNAPPTGVANMHAMYPGPNALPSVNDDSWEVVDRFWVMDATGYSAAPAASNVTFAYMDGGASTEIGGSNVFAENTLEVQRWNTSGTWGDWFGIGGTLATGGNVGNISSGAVSAANFFRSWTLSSSVDPLPVDISSFTTQCDNGTALIQWTAQTQLNNAYFTVKKSTDNVHFETVGTVAGAGTTSELKNYQIIDNNPYAGTSYYYLYQTDMDNNTNFLQTSQFTGCEGSETTTVLGYNTTNYIEVQINSTNYDNFNVTLVNLLGQTVINTNKAVALGENNFQLNNNFAPGIYILNVRNEKINYTRKLVIGVK